MTYRGYLRNRAINSKDVIFKKVGEWDLQTRLLMTNPQAVAFMGGRKTVYHYASSLAGKHLKVTTLQFRPFIILPAKNPPDRGEYLETGVDVIGRCLKVQWCTVPHHIITADR